jgi:flagellar hook-associated protein 2
MSISPLTFTGVSSFSEDFQTILSRAVSIASLPVKALQNQQSDLIQQKLLATTLTDGVSQLSTTLKNLGKLGAQKALQASSSNSSLVTATAVNATSPATYTISEITSLARVASEASVNGYATADATPVSTTGTVRFQYGSATYALDLAGRNHLQGLRDAINELDSGATATILTTATGDTPYYLSVTAGTAGATTLTLHDDPTGANTSLLTSANQGASTTFKLNGVSVGRNSTLINDLVPGTSFEINGTTTGAETVTISVATNRYQISSAIETFVDAYNSLAGQVDAQTGENAGLLSGDLLVREIQSRMRQVAAFQGTASIKGLADLGVEFDDAGKAAFNSETFNALSATAINDALSFLGTETTGFGGAAANFDAISDPVTGMAKIQLDQYEATNDRLSDQIDIMNDRIAAMQTTLMAKLQAADALLASLSSQQSILDASIQSLQFTMYGKNEK